MSPGGSRSSRRGQRSGRIVAATLRTDLADGNERLLLLVAWLRRRGVAVDLMAVGGGPAHDRFRATAPTLVVNELGRTGVAALPHALGLGVVGSSLKSLRLRRWLWSRRHATFFVHHPAAASLVSYLPGGPAHLVAALPDPTWTLGGITPTDLATLSGAQAWIVAAPNQHDEVHRRFGVPVEELGAVIDPDTLPAIADPQPGSGVVAIVTAADPWNAADPAIEMLWQVQRARPTVSLRWIVTDDSAGWLAHHDLDHAGLSGVRVTTVDDRRALDQAGIVVRTVDDSVGEALLVAAAAAGVPVVDRHGAFGPADGVGSLDIETVVQSICRLRDDLDGAMAEGRAGAARLSHSNPRGRATAVFDLLRVTADTATTRPAPAPLARLRALLRTSLWFSPKLLPLVAAAELAALTAHVPAREGIWRTLAMLVSAVSLAAGAHLANDLADRASDRAAGKVNLVDQMPTRTAAALLALCAVGGAAPWFLVPIDPWAAAVLLALVALSVAYSAPPIRLKGRAVAGITADALVAHTLPVTFAFLEIGGAGVHTTAWWWAVGAALIWASGFGVRNIIVHQILDADGDKAAGIRTYVVARGVPRAVRTGRDAFAVEFTGLVCLLVVTAFTAWGVALFFVLHFLMWLLYRRIERRPIDTAPTTSDAWLPAAESYEVWPALAYGIALAVVDPTWLWLVGAIVVVFWPAVQRQTAARAYWPFRHVVVDPAINFIRRQFRRLRRRLRRTKPTSSARLRGDT